MRLLAPELLLPAGNLEKLKLAILYGADAVYAGVTAFGLRHQAQNFTLAELETGIQFAHSYNKKVYVVLNGLADNKLIQDLKALIAAIAACKPDAFIIADRGVVALAHAYDIPIHISTQASVTNAKTAAYWHAVGAKRIVLAREVSIEACAAIHRQVPIELEVFIHGAMCASYSGKCVISNYTSARDSNRGGCIQSCRHAFGIYNQAGEKQGETAIMNAQDLLGLRHIPRLMQAGVRSLKVEGRMKSNFYVAQVAYAYRQAIDRLVKNPTAAVDDLITALEQVSNRTFSDGFLKHRQTACNTDGGYTQGRQFLGTVKQSVGQYSYVQLRAPVDLDRPRYWLTPTGAYAATESFLDLHNRPYTSRIQGNRLVKVSPPRPEAAVLVQACPT